MTGNAYIKVDFCFSNFIFNFYLQHKPGNLVSLLKVIGCQNISAIPDS